MFEIYRTEKFNKEFEKLEGYEKARINRFIEQLKIHGHEVGDALGGRVYFREKKFEGKRIYYLVYLPWNCILLAAISNKKTQQDTIDGLLYDLDEYKEFVQKLHFNE
jgi:hypothetical protein